MFELFKKTPVKLTEKQTIDLHTVLDSPLAHQLLEEEAAKRQARRIELVGKRRELIKARDADGTFSKKAVAAAEALERARQAFDEAKMALVLARAADGAARATFEDPAADIERELRSTADPRIAKMQWALGETFQKARFTLQTSKQDVNTATGPRSVLVNNAAEVGSALTALTECSTRCRSLPLEDSSTQQVAQQLSHMCTTLAPVLHAIGLNPPVVSDDDVALGSQR